MDIVAEGPAVVAEVHVEPGAVVGRGALLLTTELMKMRHEIRAPMDGVIEAVLVAPGQELAGGEALVRIAPGSAGEGAEPVAESAAEEPRADLARLEARLALLRDDARPEAVARRHEKAMRTARENIADLVDPGSFQEYGALAVAAQRTRRPLEELQARTPADGIICGTATVGGQPVAVMAVDYTVLAGTQGYFHHRKMDRLLEVAARSRLPVVLFAEGGGGRPNDWDVAPVMVAGLNVPSFHRLAAHPGRKIGIAAGFCFAGNAALFGVCDIRIATEASWIGMGGPAMIEGGGLGVVRPQEIGPSEVQEANGVLDLRVEDEAAAVSAASWLLGLDPATNRPHDTSPEQAAERAQALRTAVPADRTRAYDMRAAITALVDGGEFLELRRGFGRGLITGFARIEGKALGLMANNPLHLGGAIDAEAAEKGARFIELCGLWGLPLVTLCDTPGFMVGPETEKAAQVDRSARLFLAGARFSQPLVTVILRKGYGLGAMAMAGGGFDRPHFCCAWPSAEVGAMGIEGAVRLGNREALAAIEDPAERAAEEARLVAELHERGGALNAASLLEFDAVIDPAETPAAIARALAAARSSALGR